MIRHDRPRGGDEFAVLLSNAQTLEAAMRSARRMLQVLDEPMVVEASSCSRPSASALMCDQPAAAPTDLLRNADTAMYRAKVNGRRRFELYDAHLHSDALRVLTLENALWSALKQQPVCAALPAHRVAQRRAGAGL